MKRLFLITAAAAAFAQSRISYQQALEEAARQNPRIQLARVETLIREAGARTAASALQPQLSAYVRAAGQTFSLQSLGMAGLGFGQRVGPYRTMDLRPTATLSLFDPVLRSRIEAARLRSREAAAREDAARETVLYAAAQLYLQALEAEARFRAAESRKAMMEAVVGQTADKYNLGAASKLDFERIREMHSNELLISLESRKEADVLLSMLARVLGRDQKDTPVLEPLADPPPPPDSAPTIPAAHPELRALRAEMETGDRDIETSRRDRLPKVQAFGDYGFYGAGPDRAIATYTFGVAASIPLWTGRRIESETAAAALRRRKLDHELRDLELSLGQGLRQSFVEMESLWKSLQVSAKALVSAREAVELVKLRQGAGMATSLDTVIAANELTQVEEQGIRLRYQYHLARLRMAYALGDVRAANP